MQKAKLTRRASTDEGTAGVLTFGGQSVFTMELPWRDNKPRVSCIPLGIYECAIVRSPKFGLVYGVKNVQGRSHVLIHAANVAGDVAMGFDSQLHGCIAPAKYLGRMRNKSGNIQLAGLVSKPALTEFMRWADSKPFLLEIK